MHPGGVERQLYYLANGLASVHDVTVILCQAEGAFLHFLDSRVSVLGLDTPYRNRLQPGVLAATINILKRDRPDLLVSFHGSFHWIAVIAGKLLGIKVVCVFPGYMQKGPLWPAHRFFFHTADGLLAVSHGVKNSLIENLSIRREKISVIENAIDPGRIVEMSHEELTSGEKEYFNRGGTVMVSIGRLAEGKGFDVILNALAGLQAECSLLIIGDGPEKENLQEMVARLGLSERVFLLGNQLNPYKFLSRAGFFVLASESEGLPTVILEAMCLGIPCICAKYQGGTEGVIEHGESGFLVEPKDPAGLRCAIEYFLSPDSGALRETIVKAGKTLVERKFSVNRYVEAYLAYLDSVASTTAT